MKSDKFGPLLGMLCSLSLICFLTFTSSTAQSQVSYSKCLAIIHSLPNEDENSIPPAMYTIDPEVFSGVGSNPEAYGYNMLSDSIPFKIGEEAFILPGDINLNKGGIIDPHEGLEALRVEEDKMSRDKKTRHIALKRVRGEVLYFKGVKGDYNRWKYFRTDSKGFKKAEDFGAKVVSLDESQRIDYSKISDTKKFVTFLNKASENSAKVPTEKYQKVVSKLFEDVKSGKKLTHKDLIAWNTSMKGPADVSAVERGYRTEDVFNGAPAIHKFSETTKVEEQMTQLLEQVNNISTKTNLAEIARLYQNFILIHPFADRNGRTSRLLLTRMLVQAGFPLVKNSPEYKNIFYQSPEELAYHLQSQFE